MNKCLQRKSPFFFGLMLLLVYLSTGVQAAGNDVGQESQNRYMEGKRLYSTGDFEKAIKVFTELTETSPDNSEYHHWLAKSYGRLAEQSSLLTAYKLSQKTRSELETAVALDDSNVDALSDLKDYYTQAPVFLGGGDDKAAAIEKRLNELQKNDQGPTSR